MKLIIAGSRGITDPQILEAALAAMFKACGFIPFEEVVTGMCPGSPDMLGHAWALGQGIPVKEMPAQWVVNGVRDPKAGNRRNVEMANYVGKGGMLLALWDGYTSGTKHMINAAKARGIYTYVHKVEIPESVKPKAARVEFDPLKI